MVLRKDPWIQELTPKQKRMQKGSVSCPLNRRSFDGQGTIGLGACQSFLGGSQEKCS